ncbi:MAG: AAA family ATPase, partial [Chloroflexota bacterium]|nr:AAA family ATPase [Chloroflexota bacterium]
MNCASCGAPVVSGSKFCPECGTPVPPKRAAEVRKTVTVLFSDITGSTSLGERLDPESLRALIGRYFAEIKRIVERHGGLVEKFIGDAVMAVFGIPSVHEDDALRAVRAAVEIRERLAEMNADLVAERGLSINFRTGLNTGEVVAGDAAGGDTLVTGDTVNTATRLEQAAGPGEILIGRATHQLVRDAVVAESVEPIAAKGKAETVTAFRLIEVLAGREGRTRRMDAALVGRDQELRRLEHAFDDAVRTRIPALLSVFGAAGVGKSRLVSEFLRSVGPEVQVLEGRCLPYGDGITYWPLREIVGSAARITGTEAAPDARIRLRALLEGHAQADLVARRVGAAIGLDEGAAPQEEIFWATRQLFEHLARRSALITFWEDIHWAEPTLLDLIEYVVDLSVDTPLVLLCSSRPDLLETRAGWGGNRSSSTVVHLEPLPQSATEELLGALPGGSALPRQLRQRIVAAAEGNPLYLEEMLGMLVDEGHLVEEDGGWRLLADVTRVEVPLSVRALLAARMEALPAPERHVAQRASVAGRVFEAAAVRELASEGDAVGPSLLALVRKELVRPERSELTVGDAFQFRHLLIRDAAYDALPKAERAELHERFATWLERTAGDRLAEYDEILGYHLEQAHRYRLDLGDGGDAVQRLAHTAGEKLFRAGARAARRGDLSAAIDLLRRADAPGAGHPRQPWWRLELGETLGPVDPREAHAVLQTILEQQPTGSDPRLAARARVAQLIAERVTQPDGLLARVERELPELTDALRASGDFDGLIGASQVHAITLADAGRTSEGEQVLRKAMDFVALAEEPAARDALRADLLSMSAMGPASADELIALGEELLAQMETVVAKASLTATVGYARAMAGSLTEALRDNGAAIEELSASGRLLDASILDAEAALFLLWHDRPDDAAERARTAIETLERLGDRYGVAFYRNTVLAEALIRQGNVPQALEMLDQAAADIEGAADPRMVHTASISRAEALLELGNRDEAQAAYAALDLNLSGVEAPATRSWLLARVAELAHRLGDDVTAFRLATQARDLAAAKHFVPGLAKADALLAAAGAPT